MLIDKKINIFISSIREQKKYQQKGYECCVKDTISIDVLDLTKNSHNIVNCECDYCGRIVQNTYQTYNLNTNNNTEKFCCNNVDCMKIKRKYRLNKKYNVDNVFQMNEIKEKIIITNNTLFGVDNPHQNKMIIEKAEQTNILRYGCRNPFQNEECKMKMKQTNLIKYNVEYPTQSDEIKRKIRETCLYRFGVESPLQNSIIFEKNKRSQFKIMNF